MVLILRYTLVALGAAALLVTTAPADEFELAGTWAEAGPATEALEGEAACCDPGCDSCLSGCGRLRDNMEFFFAGDGWADELDDDDANNFGFRTGLNAGIPLLRDRGIGLQIGASLGFYDLMGRAEGDGLGIEDEFMLTTGLFKRSDVCRGSRISWAIVYDHQFHNDIGEGGAHYISLGQFRGMIGYALSARNEIGFWMTQTNRDEDIITPLATVGAAWMAEPVNQYNAFWHRNWEYGGDTTLYCGTASDPGEFVVGLSGRAPLNPRWALFGGVHYIKPSAAAGVPGYEQEIWNVTAGLVFYPGCKARACTVSGNRWLPLLPVADNGTFALDRDVHPIVAPPG
jgi:hypothetical protein